MGTNSLLYDNGVVFTSFKERPSMISSLVNGQFSQVENFDVMFMTRTFTWTFFPLS